MDPSSCISRAENRNSPCSYCFLLFGDLIGGSRVCLGPGKERCRKIIFSHSLCSAGPQIVRDSVLWLEFLRTTGMAAAAAAESLCGGWMGRSEETIVEAKRGQSTFY